MHTHGQGLTWTTNPHHAGMCGTLLWFRSAVQQLSGALLAGPRGCIQKRDGVQPQCSDGSTMAWGAEAGREVMTAAAVLLCVGAMISSWPEPSAKPWTAWSGGAMCGRHNVTKQSCVKHCTLVRCSHLALPPDVGALHTLVEDGRRLIS